MAKTKATAARPAAQLRPAGMAQPRRSHRVRGVAAPVIPLPNGPVEKKASGRVTRSGTTHTSGRVTKPKAPAKPLPLRYECTTCDRILAESAFPAYLPTDDCTHLINTCKSCLKQWISSQLQNTTFDNIGCPECPQIMQNSDISVHAGKKDYKRYDELERKHISENIPGWRWCMVPRCKGGQVHEPSLKSREPSPPPRRGTRANPIDYTASPSPPPSTDHIFTCNTCSARACVSCDRPYHEDETCLEYRARRHKQTVDEDEAAKKFIAKECKKCPSCKNNILKNGGCDHMSCSQCWTQFCWHCLLTYITINATGHGEGCPYAAPGAIDPHAANVNDLLAGPPNGAFEAVRVAVQHAHNAQNGGEGGGIMANPFVNAMALMDDPDANVHDVLRAFDREEVAGNPAANAAGFGGVAAIRARLANFVRGRAGANGGD